MRVKMVVAYDGTNYSGWQIQPNGVTIEQKLNEALQALLGEDIRVTGASRTDAGVHSLGNVCIFDTDTRMLRSGEDQLRIKPEVAGRYRGAGFLRSAGYLSSTFFQKPKDL